MSDNKKCVLVQSKVSVETAKKLDKIVEDYEFKSRYDLLQYIISAFLAVADSDGEVDEQDKELMEFCRMFEGYENSKNRVITVRQSQTRQLKLTESINIYAYVGKRGYACKTISLRNEDTHTNASVSNALATILKKLLPALYAKLMKIADEYNVQKIERVIELLADEYLTGDEDANYIHDTFQQNDGSNTYGVVTKQTKTRRYE